MVLRTNANLINQSQSRIVLIHVLDNEYEKNNSLMKHLIRSDDFCHQKYSIPKKKKKKNTITFIKQSKEITWVRNISREKSIRIHTNIDLYVKIYIDSYNYTINLVLKHIKNINKSEMAQFF